MKPLLLLFLLTLSLASVHAALSFDENTQSFKTDLKTLVTKVYRFSNTGKDTIKIAEIKTCCNCTTATVSKVEWKPGEKGEVTVSFKPENAGEFEKRVTLKIEGESRPVVLVMKGRVE